MPGGAADAPSTFCCPPGGNRALGGPICIDKRKFCCRRGEKPCLARYEAAKYPCCPQGRACCGERCCPKGTVCCDQKSGVCCRTKAACCGVPGEAADAPSTFCCPPGGDPALGGPICIDKRKFCCRRGETPCIGRYEAALYPCCPTGHSCCGEECCASGQACVEGVCQ